jgi:predicted RND superfamily exporter protein
MLYKKQNDVVECNQKQVIIVQETYDSFYKENLKQLSNIHREIKNINKVENKKDDIIIKLTQWWQENER